MKVVTDLVVFGVSRRRGGNSADHLNRLLHANTDTSIFMQAVQDVSLSTRHQVKERGGISLR